MSARLRFLLWASLCCSVAVVLLKRPKAHTQQTHKEAAAVRTRYSAPKNELLLDSVRRFLEYVILIKFGGRGRRYNDDVYVQKYNTFG